MMRPGRLMDRPRGYEPRSEGSNPSRGANSCVGMPSGEGPAL